MAPAEWRAYAIESGLNEEQVDGIVRLSGDKELWRKADDLCRVFDIIERMGLREYVEFDPEVIRGLDYYTGTVFEAQARKGGRAIFGGGRYDNLVGAVGGDPVGGVGFAMGDVMISVLMREFGLIPELKNVPAETLVTVFDEEGLPDAFALSSELRAQGLKVIVYPEAAKLQKQLKYADRVGVRYVVIAGPDERAAGQVTLKDLGTREQQTLDREQLGAVLRQRLAEAPGV